MMLGPKGHAWYGLLTLVSYNLLEIKLSNQENIFLRMEFL